MVDSARSPLHDAAAIASRSRLLRMLEQFFEGVLAAWRSSAMRARGAAIVRGPGTGAPHFVRMGGWAALSAAVVHIALTGVESLFAPPMSGVGWIAVIPLAVVCIIRPDAVVVAWNDSRRRMGQRPTE